MFSVDQIEGGFIFPLLHFPYRALNQHLLLIVAVFFISFLVLFGLPKKKMSLTDDELAAMFLRTSAEEGEALPETHFPDTALTFLHEDVMSGVNVDAIRQLWRGDVVMDTDSFDQEQILAIQCEISDFAPESTQYSAFGTNQLEDITRRCIHCLKGSSNERKARALRTKMLGSDVRIPVKTKILFRTKLGYRSGSIESFSADGFEAYDIADCTSGHVYLDVPWYYIRLDWEGRIVAGFAGYLAILRRQFDKMVSDIRTLPTPVREAVSLVQDRLRARGSKQRGVVAFGETTHAYHETWGLPQPPPITVERWNELGRLYTVRYPKPGKRTRDPLSAIGSNPRSTKRRNMLPRNPAANWRIVAGFTSEADSAEGLTEEEDDAMVTIKDEDPQQPDTMDTRSEELEYEPVPVAELFEGMTNEEIYS